MRAIAAVRAGTWPEAESVGSLTLGHDDRHRRRVRLACDDGRPVLLDLPEAVHLNEGDGLRLESGGWLCVHAAPEPVCDIEARGTAELARLAWHLGNRHLPVQILPSGLRIRDDHVVAAMLQGMGARISRHRAPFAPEAGAYDHGGHHHRHDQER